MIRRPSHSLRRARIAESQTMNIFHILLQVVQFACAIGLIVAVTSQTSKESGMGAAFGGGGDNSGNTRFTGGAEEQIENLTRNLAYGFVVLSLLVATVASKLS